ncbi:hypothetical protein OQA88_11576 [Cercophora sp. LCS_1]
MSPFGVTVHPFPSQATGSVAYERGDPSSPNAVVYIPGLTAGPHSFNLALLSQSLPASWSLWEFRMRSSFGGFGYSSLANDVEDVSALVGYLRETGKKRVVLMGHSTGCQDCVDYVKRNGPTVEGFVLLAPVSDREFAESMAGEDLLGKTVEAASKMIEAGRGDEIIPGSDILPVFTTPITAYRWWSLAAKGGDDDFFSSDLTDEQLEETFGRINRPALILNCAEDELLPKKVDRHRLLERWVKAIPAGLASENSGFVPGADHAVSRDDMWESISRSVVSFLASL